MTDTLIDPDLYEAVEKEISQAFAMSYLAQAKQHGKIVVPHTLTAWERLTQNRAAMNTIRAHGCSVQKPRPWSADRDGTSREQAA